MAKAPTSRIQSILNLLNGGFNFTKAVKSTPIVSNPLVVSQGERDKLIRLSQQSDTPAVNNIVGGSAGFLVHAQKLLRSIAHDKIENERILDMAPEVSQAAAIMIPSILSPNDLRSSTINITSNCKELSHSQNKYIGELLTNYFEKTLKFSTVVPKWIHEALYRSGAQPILILPLITLQNQLTQGSHVITSQESYTQKIKLFDEQSMYGIADSSYRTTNTLAKNEKHQSIVSATEQFATSTVIDIVKELQIESSVKNKSTVKEPYHKLVTTILAQESLSIIDNPNSIQFSEARNNTTKHKISKTTKLRYKESTLLVIDTPKDDDENIDNPLFMQLPAESVIPIYTPGTPTDHIGYFILLDEYGHPIEVTSEMINSLEHSQQYTPNQSAFQQLFQAYGMADFLQGDQHTQNAMANIYQNIVESHLKERLTNSGFGSLKIGKDNSVYRYMLSRYLQQRRTKLLFVPKDLLIYFAFKINEYGIGESTLNSLKFILALRISLIVCRMLVAFNNAIDRKRIDITFDPNFRGNVIEHMRTVQREAMRKSAVTFTHDPMAISQQIVNKSYTVKAKGIAGLTDYEISSESNQRSDASPDEQLAEDLKSLLILKLEIPAAAMNSLNDAEYSRSVVTTNLFFSRNILGKQTIVCEHLTEIVRAYVLYSKNLSKDIKDIMDNKHNDGGIVEGSVNQVDLINFEKVLNDIKVILPPPNIAPDKAQFDALDGMLSSIDSILNGALGDDISDGDQDMRSLLTAMRGLTKSKLVQKYVQDFGFGDMNIPNIEDLDQKALLDVRQTLIQMTKAIKTQSEVLNNNTASNADQFGGTDPNAGTTDPTMQTPDGSGATDTTGFPGDGDSTGDSF